MSVLGACIVFHEASIPQAHCSWHRGRPFRMPAATSSLLSFSLYISCAYCMNCFGETSKIKRNMLLKLEPAVADRVTILSTVDSSARLALISPNRLYDCFSDIFGSSVCCSSTDHTLAFYLMLTNLASVRSRTRVKP